MPDNLHDNICKIQGPSSSSGLSGSLSFLFYFGGLIIFDLGMKEVSSSGDFTLLIRDIMRVPRGRAVPAGCVLPVEEEVLSAIEGLPENMRTVIRLYYFEGLTVKEVVEKMGYCVSSARSSLKIGMHRVRVRLGG